MENNCVLVKVSPEVSLKTRFVRKYFTDKLIASIKGVFRANGVSGTKIVRGNGRLFIFPEKKQNLQKIHSVLGFVFGVHSRSLSACLDFKESGELIRNGVNYAEKFFGEGTFKVDARRESFSEMTSQQMNEKLGSAILVAMPKLKVKLSDPKNTLFVEVVKNNAFFYVNEKNGPGGLPLGCEGNVAVFFEGKKNELAAAFLVMKRGCNVFPVVKKDSEKIRTHVNKLVPWNSFRLFKFSPIEDIEGLAVKKDISVKAIVFSNDSYSKQLSEQKQGFSIAVYWPLLFAPKGMVKETMVMIDGG